VKRRYIQVWAPDNDRVPFPIITIWGGGTLSHKLEVLERRFSCVPLHFNDWLFHNNGPATAKLSWPIVVRALWELSVSQ